MDAPKVTQQNQGTENRPARKETPNLDRRYGKIGISAVAAAVAHKSAQRKKHAIGAREPFRYEYD